MARKAKRIKAGEVHLTAAGLKTIESRAFQNCRTVDQELTYMVERMILGRTMATETPVYTTIDRYDAPAGLQDAQGAPETPQAALPPAGWTPEQESEIYVLGQAAGLGDAQVTALRLINKGYEATKAAIEAEKVPA